MLYTQSVVLFASKNESNILWGIGGENIYFFDFQLSPPALPPNVSHRFGCLPPTLSPFPVGNQPPFWAFSFQIAMADIN